MSSEIAQVIIEFEVTQDDTPNSDTLNRLSDVIRREHFCALDDFEEHVCRVPWFIARQSDDVRSIWIWFETPDASSIAAIFDELRSSLPETMGRIAQVLPKIRYDVLTGKDAVEARGLLNR